MLSRCHIFSLFSALLVCAIPGSAAAQQAVGELYATDASVQGSVILAGSGTSVLSGSSIQAGAQSATLKLERGGTLLVCPGTKLSITASQTGREMLFSLNSGNVELNYPLGTEADTLLTPDLRLLLPGPGTVHVAVRVTPEGDTCVQSLPGNVAAIVLSENMGDATYQVKPDEGVRFNGGHLAQSSRSQRNCGCPMMPATQVAKTPPTPPPPLQPQSAQPLASAPLSPPEQHLVIDAPFVYRADDPIPDLSDNIASLKLDNKKLVQMEPTILPPMSSAKKAKNAVAGSPSAIPSRESRNFFSKVGAFFASIFH